MSYTEPPSTRPPSSPPPDIDPQPASYFLASVPPCVMYFVASKALVLIVMHFPAPTRRVYAGSGSTNFSCPEVLDGEILGSGLPLFWAFFALS